MKVRHGLKNICTDGKKWHWLLFCDFDGIEPTTQLLSEITDGISYMIYKTINGYHLIGLTPLTILNYAYLFNRYLYATNSYYSGGIIRIDLKDGESQKLITLNQDHEVIPNLFNVWAQRFNMQKMDAGEYPYKYRLVFEDYKSMNEN